MQVVRQDVSRRVFKALRPGLGRCAVAICAGVLLTVSQAQAQSDRPRALSLLELATNFGVVLPEKWSNSAWSDSPHYGSQYGLLALLRVADVASLGPVLMHNEIHSAEFRKAYWLTKAGLVLRLRFSSDMRIEPYLQFGVGETWGDWRGSSTTASGSGYGPWLEGALGVDFRIVRWLKAGVSLGYNNTTHDPAPCDGVLFSAPRYDQPCTAPPPGRGGATVLGGITWIIPLGRTRSMHSEALERD